MTGPAWTIFELPRCIDHGAHWHPGPIGGFAPDGIRGTGNGQRIQRGRAEIQAAVEGSFKTWNGTVRHLATPSFIEGNGKALQGSDLWAGVCPTRGGQFGSRQWTEYEDVCVKLEARRYFQERRITTLLEDPTDALRRD